MAKGGVRIVGLNKVVRSLTQVGVGVDDLKSAFGEIAAKGARITAGLAPSRTGRLAGSARGNRAKNKAVVTVGRARVPYAGPINFGWKSRGIEPSGFLQKADQEIQPTALASLEQAIDSLIGQEGLQ
ncbi:hypothetical protein [Kribbella sp. DT2]|uniref:hypothetical protein n=1 Tax=Kribbella sp. DT2 TaxID=3393427 RepID=UPI003CF2F953